MTRNQLETVRRQARRIIRSPYATKSAKQRARQVLGLRDVELEREVLDRLNRDLGAKEVRG